MQIDTLFPSDDSCGHVSLLLPYGTDGIILNVFICIQLVFEDMEMHG